jgi:hypothetical protein
VTLQELGVHTSQHVVCALLAGAAAQGRKSLQCSIPVSFIGRASEVGPEYKPTGIKA